MITDAYDGSVPLSHFLKQHFRAHPRLGSRDRKILSDMAYCWYRCSKGITAPLSFEEKMQACLFLCDTATPHTRAFLPKTWQALRTEAPGERIRLLRAAAGIDFDTASLLSFQPVLSTGITTQDWLQSMLRQPKLFIRATADADRMVALLDRQGIPYTLHTNSYPVKGTKAVRSICIALDNGTDVSRLLPAPGYVIQDAASQQTGMHFRPGAQESWWDCCAGAGGKSLLLLQITPSVRLTVSDKREHILHNLKLRFQQYHLPLPEIHVTDTADSTSLRNTLAERRFDNIICDVPCSGSGTWARTPEQLYFFREERLAHFTNMQQRIATNALHYLKPGGRLIYITCSVFAAENEMITAQLAQHPGITVTTQTLINGTTELSDSMYVAAVEKGT